ncbi:MAG: ABC transporter permease subunit [Oscillospiraceae bacterium]|nr:ABC transporter permease subunit [Oscillospiraceae bacterium]
MLNLLRSDLSRLFRLKSLLIFALLTVWLDLQYTLSCDAPGFDIFENLSDVSIGLIIEGAFIIGYLIGSDYAHGTIRNKLIAGYGRGKIFFSEWLTSFICMLLLTVESYGLIFAMGFARGGVYLADADSTMIFMGLTLLYILVCTAFFTALYMTVFSQNTAMPVAVLIVLLGLIFTAIAESDLSSPKYIEPEEAATMAAYGLEVERDAEDPEKYLNPSYTEGDSFDFLFDTISPVSHIIVFSTDRLPKNVAAMSAEIVLFTVGGLLIFIRRDLR